jgi:AmmeMemoRadiSam system protein B
MEKVRFPAVAGMFYPGDARELRATVEDLLAAAAASGLPPKAQTVHPCTAPLGSIQSPKAIIAPHAGYVYSGPVAASVYVRLKPLRGVVRRVVLLGPSHRVGFEGLAVSSADYYETPLGRVALDKAAIASLAGLRQVRTYDVAHTHEHSLEVHLPFLQTVLGEFQLVPLVVGDTTAAQVAEVLERLWGGPKSATATDLMAGRTSEGSRATFSSRGPRLDSGMESRATVHGRTGRGFDPIGEAAGAPSLARGPRLDPIGETLIVVSSDLSHYHDYDTARRMDAATSRAIEQLRYEDIGYDDACGRIPVSGLLHYARNRGLTVQTVDLRNSGDTAGPRDRVVGYGAYAIQ